VRKEKGRRITFVMGGEGTREFGETLGEGFEKGERFRRGVFREQISARIFGGKAAIASRGKRRVTM